MRRPRRGGGARERPAGRGLLGARCSGGARWPQPPRASRPPSAASCERREPGAPGGRRRAPSAALRASSGGPAPVPIPLALTSGAVRSARRSEAPAATAAAAAAAAAVLRGESCPRAAADRRTAAGCQRSPAARPR